MSKIYRTLFTGICACLYLQSIGQELFKTYPALLGEQNVQSLYVYPSGDFGVAAGVFVNNLQDLSLYGITPAGDRTSTQTLTGLAGGSLAWLEPDGESVLVKADNTAGAGARFTKHSADGTVLWSKKHVFPGATQAQVYNIRENEAGEIFICGYNDFTGATGNYTYYVAKFAMDGTNLWVLGVDINDFNGAGNILPTADGGCAFSLETYLPLNSGLKVYKVDAAGTLEWAVPPRHPALPPVYMFFNYNGSYYANPSFSRNENTGQTLAVPTESDATQNLFPSLVMMDTDGTVLWQKWLSDSAEYKNFSVELIIPMADGGFTLMGKSPIPNSNYSRALAFRIASDGTFLWKRWFDIFTGAGYFTIAAGQQLADGRIVITGRMDTDLYLLIIDNDGSFSLFPNRVIGTVERDSSYNCLIDAIDPKLEGWIVKAEGNGQLRFGTSDALGHYFLNDLDTGSVLVTLTPPNYLWQACADSIAVYFPAGNPNPVTDTVNFPVQALYNCPLMQVDVGALAFRKCRTELVSMKYCNLGNASADSSYILLQLDPLLHFDSASVPAAPIAPGIYRLEIGEVAPFECGYLFAYVTVDCDATLGQTVCATAHIYPDTICEPTPNWTGATIMATGVCSGDSVRFVLRNVGSAASTAGLDYVVVDDHVVTRMGDLPSLVPNDSLVITVFADGSSWQLSAAQEPNHPFGANKASVAVEGCSTTGTFNVWMSNAFAHYSGNPFEDTECHPVLASFDPNDKLASPEGVDAPHYIEQNERIEYRIRFQNVGNAPAENVVIRDTLSVWLDPTTFRPGAASHPYTWKLDGAGFVTFTFANIQLPDSTNFPEASQGFVQYRIDQKRDNPIGTVIENRAGIYFDENEPVITPYAWHTVGKDYLPVLLVSTENDATKTIKIFPNPAFDNAWIAVSNGAVGTNHLVWMDALGRRVREQSFDGDQIEVQRNSLPSGVYFLQLTDAAGKVWLGRMVWQ